MRYIVVVQDHGEIYRYKHSSIEEAQRYMAEVNLPCKLEIVDNTPVCFDERSTHGN